MPRTIRSEPPTIRSQLRMVTSLGADRSEPKRAKGAPSSASGREGPAGTRSRLARDALAQLAHGLGRPPLLLDRYGLGCRLQLGQRALGRDQAVALEHELAHRVPVADGGEVELDPALVADVGRRPEAGPQDELARVLALELEADHRPVLLHVVPAEDLVADTE